MRSRITNILILTPLVVFLFCCNGCNHQNNVRQEISLNGSWELAKTDTFLTIPALFNATVRVPGLVDMAEPSIDEQDTAYVNSIYWYKRKFRVERNADIVKLKINKAKYFTRVFLNGKFVGQNPYSFTPSYFNLKSFLKEKGEENELVIAVGTQNILPDSVTNGKDFEKLKYIPGIYDDVKLILSERNYIANIQVVPDIKSERIGVIAQIETPADTSDFDLSYSVRELVSEKIVAKGKIYKKKPVNGITAVDFDIPISGYKLWSPENPFLYELELFTDGDNTKTRFGMRSFASDREKGVVLLNGKTYYMRGTNVCVFRFFEDPDRTYLPWDTSWATTLHKRFKDMHWNSIRYCIGFPPERWYEIADSLGFLIQDEFPVWTGGKGGFEKILPGVTSVSLANEYKQWMQERWNHPCVVIWDGQNESVNDTTAIAINLIRNLDLSNRPWDNGWAAPANETDMMETHPYLYSRYWKNGHPAEDGALKEFLSKKQIPNNGPNSHRRSNDIAPYKNPIIINEYGWIWLNRDGSPTTLTERIYNEVFPEADTPQKRLEVYAKTYAALTEYWRAHRTSAGVLHFCGLGYSRPNEPKGQTSDNFIDIKKLVYEPNFYAYVKPAFAPVGVMIELWDKKLEKGSEITVPVHVINDTYENVKGNLTVQLFKAEEEVFSKSLSYEVDELDKQIIPVEFTLPANNGDYRLLAKIDHLGKTVQSIREFEIE